MKLLCSVISIRGILFSRDGVSRRRGNILNVKNGENITPETELADKLERKLNARFTIMFEKVFHR